MSNALIWIFAGICAWGCLIGAALSFANINTGVFLSPVFAALIGIAILMWAYIHVGSANTVAYPRKLGVSAPSMPAAIIASRAEQRFGGPMICVLSPSANSNSICA